MPKGIKITLIAVSALIAVGAFIVGLRTLSRPTPAESTAPVLSTSENSPSDSTQLSDGGGVQVQVTFERSAQSGQTVVFQVSMNTHSVELGNFDLTKLTQVRLEPGATLNDISWKPEGNGSGHHVSGKLTARDPQGLLASAKSITLEIWGVAGEEVRQFHWKGM